MKSLSFLITNDLLFAEVIAEDASPGEIQSLVQARLSQDSRFREKIVHLAYNEGRYKGEPVCNQVGRNLNATHNPTQVTCLRCLNMHCMRGLAKQRMRLAAEADRARDSKEKESE